MNLLLQRSQQQSLFRTIEYVLQVTIVCTADDLNTLTEHGLHHNQLFVVPEVETHQQNARQAFERADNRSVFDPKAAAGMFTDHAAGLIHLARAKLAFAVTVADAIEGTTIICRDLREMVRCERQITDAFDELHQDLENVLAFTTDREQVLAPEGAEEPDGIAPANWANRQNWWRH